MAEQQQIKIGDWINTPSIDYEVEVVGRDNGTGELIVHYILDSGRDAYKTVPVSSATLFVDPLA